MVTVSNGVATVAPRGDNPTYQVLDLYVQLISLYTALHRLSMQVGMEISFDATVYSNASKNNIVVGGDMIQILEWYSARKGYPHYTVERFDTLSEFLYRCIIATKTKIGADYPTVGTSTTFTMNPVLNPYGYLAYMELSQ